MIPGHYRRKAATGAASTAVDFVETVCEDATGGENDDELDDAVEAGLVGEQLATKARSVAAAVERAL